MRRWWPLFGAGVFLVLFAVSIAGTVLEQHQ